MFGLRDESMPARPTTTTATTKSTSACENARPAEMENLLVARCPFCQSDPQCDGDATLRSSASACSNLTASTIVATFGAADEYDTVELRKPLSSPGQHTHAMDCPDLNSDPNAVRQSFKGFPPELYSAKKEFIYARPLVKKQLVLKKTFEWWFHKFKWSNMSTNWKRNACLTIITLSCVLGLSLSLYFFLHNEIRTGSSQNSNKNNTNRNGNYIMIDEAALPTHYQIDVPDLPTTFIDNHDNNKNKNNNNNNNNNNGTFITDERTTITPPYHFDMPDIQTTYVNETFITDDWSDEDDIENDIDDLNNSLPDDLMSDIATPKKVYNFSLNADDLLYESKRNHHSNNSQKDFVSAFSVTGTFRTKSSQIWDPHPEYILNTFGQQLHLVLNQDTSFIPPRTFRVIRILNNRTEEEEDEAHGHYLGCYYKGVVQGDEQSAVAVSLCNGMTGYIKTSFGTMLIQPVNQSSTDDADMPHKVWRHARRNARHTVSGDLDLDLQVLEQSVTSKLLRKKRNYVENPRFTIEVLFAVDRTMQDFHKEDLKSYILTLISIVSNIFSDASIGNSIGISVANILILPDNISAARMGRRRAASASDLLKTFCEFPALKTYHYDTAMLITRDQICRNEREKCDTLGLAGLGTVCKKQSCSILQDNGLPAAFTIAHELGHILNMPHDDDDNCRPFNQPGKNKLHIMSSIMGDNIHPWSWSDCSRHFVSEFLEKEDKSCLEDTPTSYIQNYNTKLPGEIYSLDHQCQLINGNQSKYCYIDDECRRLWCKDSEQNAPCRSINLPWADGTPCNNNHNWCQKGKCVPREGNSLQVVNGGWSPWSAFTSCSLSCGGGVQESIRECDSPRPKNGGKYCSGSHKKYRSCNTQPCPAGLLDSREEQCHKQNGRVLNIKGFKIIQNKTLRWIPKYGLEVKDKCKLFCRLEDDTAYFKLEEKVIDGTTCSFDSFDKCVNGICRPAGCDNELNSIAKLDKCGVCEGRNDTCEEFTGNFYVSDLFKQPKTDSLYHYVTKIPKGASNIVITQPGYRDDNYIALSNDQRAYLVNGDSVISHAPKRVFYAGITFEYNGASSPVERVNTTYSRKLKRDLIVEVVSIGTIPANDNDSIIISYTYTLDKPDYVEPELEIYRWEMQSWSLCDSMCQGRSFRLPACVSTTKVLKVAPQFCEESAKPKIEYRVCNTDCMLTLNVSSISECSASCGMLGTREKTYNCIQTFPSVQRSNVVDMSYCELKYEVVRHEQCREGCWDYTDWSPCTKTCGTGMQTRNIGCFLNQTRVSDALCSPRQRNLNDRLRACNTEPCYPYEDTVKTSRSVNNWLSGNWGECDDKCERNRTVTCTHPSRYGCDEEKRPNSKRKCCHIKYVSYWSKCSVECGTGTKARESHCARVYKPEIKGTQNRRVFIDDSNCRHLQRKIPKKPYKTCKIPCKWESSNWTQCPFDCSSDYQTRSVYCEQAGGNVINNRYCDSSKKPTTQKICNNCVRRQSKIVSRCNCDGYERRKMLCYNRNGHRIQCPTKERVYKLKCTPPRSCMPQSCAELQSQRQQYKDGEYTIFVRSRPKKIYCHNMSSAMPKEYVTVNSMENYSIYYDYKTRNPDQCPPDSRRLEYHHRENSGRTSFRKIRVNITDMRVIENDFTFADTVGTQAQPYGSAGDCYNRNQQCPQGDFSINLKHTGFAIRPGTEWNRFGPNVVMKTSNEFHTSPLTRRALCGGYCGRCAISQHSGLYLDVM